MRRRSAQNGLSLMEVIRDELLAVREQYGDERRTEISMSSAEINIEDLIQEEDMVVTISHAGYLKRTPTSTYRAQRRGGKGMVGMEARDEDWVNQLFVASTHSYVFFFSDKGKVYVKKVYEIPQAPRNAKGRAIVNFVGMEPGEKVAAITPIPGFPGFKAPVIVRPPSGKIATAFSSLIKATALLKASRSRRPICNGIHPNDCSRPLSSGIGNRSCRPMYQTRRGIPQPNIGISK